MKKLLLTVLLLLTFTLSGCEEKEEETKYNIPKENSVSMNDQPYAEYAKLTNPRVTISVRDMGDIVVELFPDVAPNTVNNFIAYIDRGDYQDNEFHRVMINFMIQGGKLEDPYCTIQGEMNNNPEYEGTNDLSHYKGVISMARVGGMYDSASSQFFIMHEEAFYLDKEYAAFGGVVSGFNILNFIAQMNDGVNQIPYEPVYIDNITVDLRGYEPEVPVCED